MIKSITVTNFLNKSLELELRRPDKTGLLITSIEGLGPADGTINTTEVSTNDGSLYNSARLSQRNIVIDFTFLETDTEKIEDIRLKTYQYFPIKKQLTLKIETDNRTVKISGYVESNEPDIFSEQETAKISIICPDPYFYSAGDDGTIQTTFFSVTPLFEFPFCNDSLTDDLLEFGETEIQTDGVVTYYGDTDVGITIHIHATGSATNLTIYNINTREEMTLDTSKIESLTGSGIIASDDITISTVRGNKSVSLLRAGTTYNILNALGKNCDWFMLTRGDNLFAFSAESGIEHLQFEIENQILYEGI